MEPRYDEGKGPDLLFQMGHQLVMVDVTIANPLDPSYVEMESKAPGNTLVRAEATKHKTYGSLAATRGMKLFPLAFSAFGVLGNETLAFLRKCGGYTSDRHGFLRHAIMAIGIAIQRGNAQIISAATFQWRQTGILQGVIIRK